MKKLRGYWENHLAGLSICSWRTRITAVKEATLALLAIVMVVSAAWLADYNFPWMGNRENPSGIPLLTSQPVPREGNFLYSYILKEGDTLEGIASQAEMPIESLVQMNGLHPNAILTPGKELTLTWGEDLSRLEQDASYSMLQPVLTAQSSEAEIWERISNSNKIWKTLWADVSTSSDSNPALHFFR